MAQLPVKKIYVDSQYSTSDSTSTSTFKFQLGRNVHLPQNTVFYLEDVCIPHSWYTIEPGINDTFYFGFSTAATPPSGIANPFFVIYSPKLPSTNYTGSTLATALQTALDTAVGLYNYNGYKSYFVVSYNVLTNSISITFTQTNVMLYIPSDNDLIANPALFGYSGTTPPSCNELMGNQGNMRNYYTSSASFFSGILSLNPFRNIFISSPNLGSFSTLGARGESNIIKKVPVTSDYGYLIVDSFTSTHDFLDCSRLTLGTIEFNLRDVRGNLIPLHGAHVSFSIVFSTVDSQ